MYIHIYTYKYPNPFATLYAQPTIYSKTYMLNNIIIMCLSQMIYSIYISYPITTYFRWGLPISGHQNPQVWSRRQRSSRTVRDRGNMALDGPAWVRIMPIIYYDKLGVYIYLSIYLSIYLYLIIYEC